MGLTPGSSPGNSAIVEVQPQTQDGTQARSAQDRAQVQISPEETSVGARATGEGAEFGAGSRAIARDFANSEAVNPLVSAPAAVQIQRPAYLVLLDRVRGWLDPQQRYEAASERLLERLDRPISYAARCAAVNQIGTHLLARPTEQTSTSALVEALSDLMVDPSEASGMREAAVHALDRFTRSQKSDSRQRLAFVEAAANIVAMPTADVGVDLKEAALFALAGSKQARALAEVTAAISDRSPRIALAAGRVMSESLTADIERQLLKALLEGGPETAAKDPLRLPNPRVATILALSKDPKPSTCGLVASIILDPRENPLVRQLAVEYFRNSGNGQIRGAILGAATQDVSSAQHPAFLERVREVAFSLEPRLAIVCESGVVVRR